MSATLQDKFVLDVFGLDMSSQAPPGAEDDGQDDFDAPPPAEAALAPLPPPSKKPEDWAGAADLLASTGKQIDALELWGVAAAAKFKTALGKIDTDASSGKDKAALKALIKLAADVQKVFDKERMPAKPSAKEKKARQASADKVTQTGGTGTKADAALVKKELTKMPSELLAALEKNGTKVTACKGSVTDYLADLKGVQPRGWPTGMTWDSVPGLYRPQSKEVVIATKGDKKKAHVPATGEGHGSASLVIHETAHGVDASETPAVSAGGVFTAARTPDVGALPPYETQPDPAGPEETFAESCARFYTGDRFSAESTPHLHKYWRSNPLKKT